MVLTLGTNKEDRTGTQAWGHRDSPCGPRRKGLHLKIKKKSGEGEGREGGKEEGGRREQRKSSLALWKEKGGNVTGWGGGSGHGNPTPGSGPKDTRLSSPSPAPQGYVLLPHLSQAGQERPELRPQ